MSFSIPWTALTRIRESDHVGQLHRDLVILADRVRATVAEVVGRAVAGIARQTVLSSLGSPSADLRAPPLTTELHSRPRPPWDRREDPELWDDVRRETDPRDWDLPEEDELSEEERWLSPRQAREEDLPPVHAWRPALVIALQAFAWWLWRQARRWPVRAALGFGLACSLALYLSRAVNQNQSGLALTLLTDTLGVVTSA